MVAIWWLLTSLICQCCRFCMGDITYYVIDSHGAYTPTDITPKTKWNHAFSIKFLNPIGETMDHYNEGLPYLYALEIGDYKSVDKKVQREVKKDDLVEQFTFSHFKSIYSNIYKIEIKGNEIKETVLYDITKKKHFSLNKLAVKFDADPGDIYWLACVSKQDWSKDIVAIDELKTINQPIANYRDLLNKDCLQQIKKNRDLLAKDMTEFLKPAQEWTPTGDEEKNTYKDYFRELIDDEAEKIKNDKHLSVVVENAKYGFGVVLKGYYCIEQLNHEQDEREAILGYMETWKNAAKEIRNEKKKEDAKKKEEEDKKKEKEDTKKKAHQEYANDYQSQQFTEWFGRGYKYALRTMGKSPKQNRLMSQPHIHPKK